MTSPRQKMKQLYRAPEPEVLKPLLQRAALTAESRARVLDTAGELIADLRAAQAKGWVNQFLQEYRLNSSEGVALLSLAEAFLRVPDPETADRLIADKIGEADWRSHTGESNSKLVNAATWGLVVGRALVSDGGGADGTVTFINRATREVQLTDLDAGDEFVLAATSLTVPPALRERGLLMPSNATLDVRWTPRDGGTTTGTLTMTTDLARQPTFSVAIHGTAP